MVKGSFKRVVYILFSVLLISTMLAGCTEGKDKEEVSETPENTDTATKEPEVKEPLLEYSFYAATDAPQTYVDNPNDIVTPMVEGKFNIKVSKVLYNQGLSFKERFTQFIASNDLPDVITALAGDAVLIASSGRYAEVGDLIKENMPNLMKYAPEDTWGDAMYNGRMYSVPSPLVLTSGEQYKDDLYTQPMANWAWFTRESILKKLGYTFKPLKEIQQQINETQQKPTLDDFKVEPAIETPEDFYQFLKKVKELNIKVGDRAMIPLTIPHALQIHLGYMFGVTNSWAYDVDTKQVDGWLSSPNAKAYYQFLNKLYNEGLIDKDFAIQKPEQIQEKLVIGTVAAGMWSPDLVAANTALQAIDPDDQIREMPMPRLPGLKPTGIDHVSPVTFQFFIRKDFEDIPRLLKYFDWFLSDEAMDLNVWGPENLGLWEMKDGKKVFKDQALYDSLSKGETEKGTVAYEKYIKIGLGGYSEAFKTAIALNGYTPIDWRRSYPFKVSDIYSYSKSFISNVNIDTKGLVRQGNDETTNAASSWWWGEFTLGKSPKLFAAKSDADFEKNWEELHKEFLEKGKYEEAKKAMTDVFKLNGFGN